MVVAHNKPLKNHIHKRELKLALLDIYGSCVYCCQALTPEEATVDHVLPKGNYPDERHNAYNLILACTWCNTIRSDMPFDEFCEYVATPKYWQVRRKLIRKQLRESE